MRKLRRNQTTHHKARPCMNNLLVVVGLLEYWEDECKVERAYKTRLISNDRF